MHKIAKICRALCMVIVSTSAIAAPYSFKISCNDPARMRHVGEETEFRIHCTDLRKAGVGGEVDVRLDNFGMKTIISRKVDPAKENPIVLKGTLDEPGFLRAAAFNPGVAETPFGLGKGNECASVGYEPEKIRPGFPRPADFDSYWQGERERLRRDVPIDVRRESLSAKGRKGFKLWKVSFATFGGKRVWGWLSVPDDGSKGPWPLKVNVPGAGPASSEAQATTEAGVVTLVMNVHPFEPARTYKEQDAKYKEQDKRLVAKYGVTYATAGIAVSREECFFHDAILGIDRAVDWAGALPEVDRSRVWYYGGSQGGGFGMYLMGLNKNFTRGCVWVCALADHGGYLLGRTPGWPRMVARSGDEAARKAAERYAPYFDACHFAPLVKVPVRMTAGLADVCCPPPSVWSAYNSLGSADKKIVPCPGVGHSVPNALRDQQHRWLAQGAATAANGELVKNGGFDEVDGDATVGWRNVGKQYVFRDGAGRNGTRGLCYENNDPKFYSFPGQPLALKAGRVYEFEVWVRTENLQGEESGATICIEWCDAKGKWRGGAYPSGVKGTSGWTCVKGMTARIPADATSVRVNPYVRKGMTGKAWFDDLSVREYVPPPVTGLYSTAYRNVASDGDVTFRAALDVPADRAGPGLAVWFTYLNAKGDTCRTCATNRLGDSVTLNVTEMEMGPQRVSAELFDGTNVIGSATCAFTRVERLPQRAVWFDKYGRTIVNGKPFFPLGMYWGAITTNKIETYAKGPFNCLMPYHAPTSSDLMDLCHARGLKVIYSVKDIYHGTRWAPKGIESDEDEVRFIKNRVSRFKDHPALLAWYLNDELPLSMLSRLTARRALMEELDPGHPGWTVLYQYTMIRDYMPSFDVVGTDPYPIPSKPAATATEWTRQTVGGTLGCKPVWQVPQAFNWAAYKKTPEEKAKCRAPTEAELRSMCWQCIANGANGLIMYSFFDLEKRPNGEMFERRWAECCRVGAEIREQFPVLLSAEGAGRRIVTGVSHMTPDDDWAGPKHPVSARGWIKDGATYILVVNGYEKALHVRVGLIDAGYSAAASVFGPAPKLVQSAGRAAVELDLAPLEPAFIRLDASSSSVSME